MQRITNFLAQVKGLPTIACLILVVLSLLCHLVPGLSFLALNDLLLHLGVIVGLGGLLLSDAL